MSEPSATITRKLRQALGTFATGVSVVTTVDDASSPRGFTANSFSSVSLEPPLILVCLARDAASCPVFSTSRHFCVNVLAEHQQDVSDLFSSPGDDRFSALRWQPSRSGCPVLDDVISWFECATYAVHDAGDHIILVGRILDYAASGRSPLVYCRGSYVEFGLLQRAMEAAGSGISTRVSAVVDCDGAIPMIRDDATGRYSLPAADHVGDAVRRESLVGRLAANGIVVEMPFVCAIYEDADAKTNNIVYRGASTLQDESLIRDYVMIPLDRMPWEELQDRALGMLLERYIKESERDAFGVYVGDSERGEVHALGGGR